MDFSPFSLLVVKVFSLITGGLGAEACAQILKVPLEAPVRPGSPRPDHDNAQGRCGIADAERMAGGVRRDR